MQTNIKENKPKSKTTKSRKVETLPKAESDEVETVFEHWQKVLNHPRTSLDKKRIKFIKQGLKFKGLSGCLKAINGMSKTPHNNGVDGSYDGLHIVFADLDNMERFIRNDDKPPKPKRSSTTDDNMMVFKEIYQEGLAVDLSQVPLLREGVGA